jgi:hypothetical protein
MSDVATLLDGIERLEDARAREMVRGVVQALLDLHGAGLAPMVEALRKRVGDEAVLELSRDPAVAPLLLLHGLHPVDARVRAREALGALGPALHRMNASAHLDEVEGAPLRVQVREHGPSSRGATAMVEAALLEAVPDATVLVEPVRDSSAAPDAALVPVDRLTSRRRVERTAGESERCDLCASDVAPDHDHVFDPSSRELRCTCRACASLFSSPSARWKRVPRRAELLPEFRLGDDAWDALCLPIDLAFFYRSTSADRVVAMYPGPAGATESLLSLGAWARVEDENPVLRELAADVEALLVRRTRTGHEHYRVSIDACFALVGRIRKYWKGLGGGQQAWQEVSSFFADLRRASEGGAPCWG